MIQAEESEAERARLAAERAKRRADLFKFVKRGIVAAGSVVGSVIAWVGRQVSVFVGWLWSAKTNLAGDDGRDTKNTTLALVKLVAVVLVAFVFVIGLIAVLRQLV